MTTQPLRTAYRRFTASDGEELSYTLWSRGPVSECRTLVLVLHGIGFHSGPYSVVAESVHEPDALFAGLDFRGHGRSGGVRGELPSLRRMLLDIDEWVHCLRSSYPARRTFLIGESLAGPYASLYATQKPGGLGGLVLVAPAVLVSWRQLLHANTLRSLLGLWRGLSSASVNLSGSRLTVGSKGLGFSRERLGGTLTLGVLATSESGTL